MDVHARGVEIAHLLKDAAALLAQLHDVPHILAGGINVRVRDRLLRKGDGGGVRVIRGVVDRNRLPVRFRDMIHHARRGRDQVQMVFALQPLLHHLHVEKAQKAAPKAEAQRGGGLRLERERGVVELQPLQRIPQVGVMRAVRRVNAAEHHGLRGPVAGQRLVGGAGCEGDRVAHARLLHRLDGSGNIADLPGGKAVRRLHAGGVQKADLHHGELAAHRHHPDDVARSDHAVLDADVDDDAAVGIVIRIEDQRLQRRVLVALRRRDVPHDLFHHLVDVHAVLGGDAGRVVRRDPDDILDFGAHALRVGAGQVDLVDDRQDLEPGVRREIGVGQGLRLDALRGVHHQHGALARRQRTRNLVIEIDMAGRVDQIENIVFSVLCVVNKRHGVRLDGDAPFPLQIHIVQNLIFHFAPGHRLGLFQDTVGKGALSMVDMCNDAEIADSVAQHRHVIT